MNAFLFALILPISCHGLTLNTNKDEIQIGVTDNVSLTCVVDAQQDSVVNAIILIKILKLKPNETEWEPLAEMRDTDDVPRILKDLDVFASGNIGKKLNMKKDNGDVKSNSFLNLTWAVADGKTVGKYRCDLIGLHQNHDPIMSRSPLVEIKERSLLTILQLHKLVTGMEANLKTKIDTQATDVQRQFNELRESSSIIINWFRQYWPEGLYGLHKPSSGCPANIGVTWMEGSRTQNTESTSRNHDKLSDGNHFGSILSRVGTNNIIIQNFCMMVSRSNGPLWPKGSYCIAIGDGGGTPRGFSSGYIRWSDESTSSINNKSGHLPWGDYGSTYTVIRYACRGDSPANKPIYLPTEKPFYLYRFGGTCQLVHGMDAKEEYILFDTDDRGGNSKVSMSPDSSWSPDVKLELCYYSPK